MMIRTRKIINLNLYIHLRLRERGFQL